MKIRPTTNLETGKIIYEKTINGKKHRIEADNPKELKEKIAELTLANGNYDVLWKPKMYEIYWYINYGGIISISKWLNDNYDMDRYSIGNCYPTREAARKALERQKAEVWIKRYIAQFAKDNGLEVGFRKGYDNYELYYNHHRGNLDFTFDSEFQILPSEFYITERDLTDSDLAEKLISDPELLRQWKIWIGVE